MNHLFSVCMAAGVLAAAEILASGTATGSPLEDGFGSATVRVVHLVTGEPLPGMPVTVRFIDPEDDASTRARVFVTGRDGSVLLTRLAGGTYEVYVEFNNHRSESEFFTIDPVTDYHPVVTIEFNPDIDPSR